ncbi:MAG: histidine triad nucleotide-binding protein [Candidatus Omnitrophica bacterium]|nr:histidine triad nucleotide-binding protein [Candidatus Omnitrophota bacterium]
MQSDKCIFCKIARKEIPAKIVYEDDQVLAFEDTKPQAPVHVLIIPHDHIEKVSDLNEKDAVMAGKVIIAAKKIARAKGLDDSGYRIVMNCNRDAGQEVFHIHAHLMGGRKFNWPPG